jgi:zinc D-Ala-D-Ala carboxypeptidase
LTGGVTRAESLSTTTRRMPRAIAGLLVGIAAIGGGIGYQLLALPSTVPAPPAAVLRPELRGGLGEADGVAPVARGQRGERGLAPGDADGAAPEGAPVLPRAQGGALGEVDGVVPDDATVFDDGTPGIANLDPDLLAALRHAATDASADGIELIVESGWRSAAYQERLFREAVLTHGSEDEAARWVASPGTSAHESGDAVDIGHGDARRWLSENGAAYGLCQIYGNEPWHYELRPRAIDEGCPPMYADTTHHPRTQH